MNILEGLDWEPLWATHVGCIKGCVDYLKLGHSVAWVYGGSGHAFVLNVSADLCPSGPTTWEPEPFYELGRNLGYEIKTVHGHKGMENFPELQKEAWELVNLALNAGSPCYGWELLYPEYYVIRGYDQNHYHFLGPGADADTKPKLWMELGETDIGVIDMHAVRPLEEGPADDVTVVKAALEFAVAYAQTGKWAFAGAGSKGYDNWIKAFESGKAHPHGAAYNAAVWTECRKYAVEFLKEAKKRLDDKLSPMFDEATSHYKIVRDNLEQVAELFPFQGMDPEHVKDKERTKKAIEALKVSREAEEKGLAALEKIAESI
ncbi:hypothetical protein GF359_05310 [candidate division WOR-3 bacterium]|uniref:Uncharacterized protein n=1 Tax=candidate division WOR-3 bacterium TaxID=2052148 RepID=A0A9D5K9H4_UNCW3|nr:hypothetical protein [candidate division WOR-3 bacterium]